MKQSDEELFAQPAESRVNSRPAPAVEPLLSADPDRLGGYVLLARIGMGGPRRLLVADVRVSNILDLRTSTSRAEVGLTTEDLMGPHTPCQAIGQAAHQLGLHGVIAPAATGLGETLALFERHLPANELPTLVEEVLWERLPPDPRVPRLVEEQSAAGE